MPQWYETNYCDHRDWILDNLDYLSLNHTEVLITLLIDFCNEHHIKPTYDVFRNKLALDDAKIDQLIYGLSAKGYLNIDMDQNGITYDLTPLFKTPIEVMACEAFEDVFKIFDEMFGRPLNGTEMAKLSELLKIYDKKSVIDALRVADAYQKVNMGYIEKNKKNGQD